MEYFIENLDKIFIIIVVVGLNERKKITFGAVASQKKIVIAWNWLLTKMHININAYNVY